LKPKEEMNLSSERRKNSNSLRETAAEEKGENDHSRLDKKKKSFSGI